MDDEYAAVLYKFDIGAAYALAERAARAVVGNKISHGFDVNNAHAFLLRFSFRRASISFVSAMSKLYKRSRRATFSWVSSATRAVAATSRERRASISLW